MNERIAKCLLISKVLVADGIMTPAEKEFLRAAMSRLELSPDEQQRVFDLEGWDDAEPLVAGLSSEDKHALVDELTHAAVVDGNLGKQELEVVQHITRALGLDD
jgi:uncharacterized tellurite resistance protein B-like protein